MPRGDGTGPQGMGPMTGRAAGICAENDTPGYANPLPGRGMGFGRGRGGRGRGFGGGGRGWRNWFYATGLPGWMRFGISDAPVSDPASARKSDPVIEKQALQEQANALQAELDSIKQRLSAIEADSATEQVPSA